jgi:cyclophilin family peptidyl-prolyl cis-trans isomerase
MWNKGQEQYDREKAERGYSTYPLMPFPSVYLEVGLEEEPFGIIEIELFPDTPKTSENFRALCTGEKGFGENKKRLHYHGNHFHRAIPNLIIQAGDFIWGDGSGGESIYGKYFPDENFKHKHDKGYLLGSANCGIKDSNTSQFYITLTEAPWLNNDHVVFGAVIKGFKIIDRIANTYGTISGKVKEKVYILNCGETKSLYVKGRPI